MGDKTGNDYFELYVDGEVELYHYESTVTGVLAKDLKEVVEMTLRDYKLFGIVQDWKEFNQFS